MGAWLVIHRVFHRPLYNKVYNMYSNISVATYNPKDRLNASLKVLLYINSLQIVDLLSS